ncbi:putative ferric reductase transmembrane component [Termitomyces sp. T112]|nr:putative ferric reductase transmembrane component [Termitomyces sp. T112]
MAILNVTQVLASQKSDPDHSIRVAHAMIYPEDIWFCIATFIAFISLCHAISLLVRTLAIPRFKRSYKNTPTRGVIALSRLPLAIANAFRAITFRSTVQLGASYTLNIAEVFVTVIYITFIFVWALVNSTNTKGQKYDPKYWANVAANIATTQLPLITALGTKNNIISYLTGIGYERLQYFHRTFARVVCVLIWVHAAGRIKIGLVGSLSIRFPWIRCGLLAATAFTILSIMSIRPLRRRHYEIFLIFHFVMVFIVLLGGYLHARANAEGNHIWPAFLIWGLDRAFRGIRILIYNIGYVKKGSPEQYGHLEALSPHFVRLTLQRPTYMHWRPGQNVYLTIPSVSGVFLEAHPFTISTIDTPLDVTGGESNDEDQIGKEGSVSGPDTDSKTLTFLIRVRSGFTKRLLHAFSQTPEMKVILDGPYGSPPSLRDFETVVLIAGGSGVSFTLSLFLDLIHRAKQGTTDCQKVIFIWAIRDASDITLISDTLLTVVANPPSRIAIDIRIHVTASNTERLKNSEDGSDEENKADYMTSDAINLPGINIANGRPDLTRLVREETAKAIGAISFNVCGTPTMSNTVRSALCRLRFWDVLRGGASTALHVESFGNT